MTPRVARRGISLASWRPWSAPLDLHGLLGAVSGARYLPRTVATPGDQSPLKLAAKCRDARVPYTFPFSDFLATQKK